MLIMSHKVILSLTYASIPMCRILNRDELRHAYIRFVDFNSSVRFLHKLRKNS